MFKGHHCCAVLPARDEALAITQVVGKICRLGVFDRIIVCDNGSSDGTAALAKAAGAEVVNHQQPGYGGACLRALAEIQSTDTVVFFDADDSLVTEEAIQLLESIHRGADLAIGTRIRRWREPGSMTPAQIFGNWFACHLIAMIWKHRFSDLGPFRAIRFDALNRLEMKDPGYGWTVEMQIKAIQHRLKVVELPVHYRRRIGQSKISGTVRGVIAAARGIIGTIFKLRLQKASKPTFDSAVLHPRK